MTETKTKPIESALNSTCITYDASDFAITFAAISSLLTELVSCQEGIVPFLSFIQDSCRNNIEKSKYIASNKPDFECFLLTLSKLVGFAIRKAELLDRYEGSLWEIYEETQKN